MKRGKKSQKKKVISAEKKDEEKEENKEEREDYLLRIRLLYRAAQGEDGERVIFSRSCSS